MWGIQFIAGAKTEAIMVVGSRGLTIGVACALTAALAIGVGAQTTSTPPNLNTLGDCRLYDTSSTAVTVAGSITVTITTVSSFDPWAARMTSKVNYSDSRGIRSSYDQVTSYDSTEDFVAEAVRIKSPAKPNPGPRVNIVPPLQRFRTTVATGQTSFVLTNSFDGSGRVSGASISNSYGTIKTTYTAWDDSGRPTAGTEQGPQNTMSVSIKYDDLSRTSTTTKSTRGITSVGTQQFTVDGNPTVYRQTGAGLSTTTTTSGGTQKVCIGDQKAAPMPKLAPNGPTPNGSVTGSFGGQAFKSTGVQAAGGPILQIGAGDGRYLLSLGVPVTNGPGEYMAGMPDMEAMKKMDPQTLSELLKKYTATAVLQDTISKAGWAAGPTLGSGSINVTSISGGGASGTFNLTLEPTPGTSASGKMTISGTFNVKF